MASSETTQMEQFREAERLAFENNAFFDQILDTTISICLSTPCKEFRIQYQCLSFIYKAFYLKRIESVEFRSKNCVKLIDLLDYFIIRNDERNPNYILLEKCIDILNSVYDLIFLEMAKNPSDENEGKWFQLSNIRDYLMMQWPSSYPLLPLNKETDISRSIGCKNSITKLMGRIIQTHLPPSSSSKDNVDDISIALVPRDHPFLSLQTLTAQAQALLDSLLNLLNDDLLLPTAVFSTVVSTLLALFKTRPKYVSGKFINFTLGYESQLKRSPKFEESEKLKMRLLRRFNDRIDKCLISFLLNKGFINKDPSLKTRFENKFGYLVERARDQKQRGLLADDNDEDDEELRRIKRRKLQSQQERDPILFYNECKIARSNDYKSIYALIDPNDKLSEFDMSTIPTDLLSTMVVAALSKTDTAKLVKGLSIVSDRYKDIALRPGETYQDSQLVAAERVESGEDENYDPAATEGAVVKKMEEDVTFGGDDDDELSNEPFVVPLAKELTDEHKKEQLRLMIDNFIKSTSKQQKQGQLVTSSTSQKPNGLEKIAISSWSNDSWVRLLSRLATRGLNNNEQLSNYVRESLFEYLKMDLKLRMDGVIEWLNEEYYSAVVETGSSEATIYLQYTNQVLDNLIPFLESTDRKIFIRLLSELPYLDKQLISKIRSLCVDPVRSKLGFQSLLYLIMFRPPVLQDCISVLKEMYQEAGSDEKLRKECANYLTKYSPGFTSE